MVNDDDDQIGALLGDDNLLLGLSDAGAHTSQLCDANYSTWLLSHWCRDLGVLTLEQAVWRLTGHPAEVLGVVGRVASSPGSTPTWWRSTRSVWAPGRPSGSTTCRPGSTAWSLRARGSCTRG